jgi:hypothetical protein
LAPRGMRPSITRIATAFKRAGSSALAAGR